MIMLPHHLYKQYQEWCIKSRVAAGDLIDYVKWLRYFLDFCEKYHLSGEEAQRCSLFLKKLQQKGQSEEKRKQAQHAIYLYSHMIRANSQSQPAAFTAQSADVQKPQGELVAQPHSPDTARKSFYLELGYQEKSDSPEWDEAMGKLAAEIKVRHYSKTLQAYAKWSRSFQKFLKNKPPAELSTVDVKEYLTYLAVKCHVAASTQNQAFNSLLFLYRHALKREFGELRDVPRAKKSHHDLHPLCAGKNNTGAEKPIGFVR